MKKIIVLAFLMIALSAPAFAECDKIEFAELQSMSSKELTAKWNDYVFQRTQYSNRQIRLGSEGVLSREWDRLDAQSKRCSNEIDRIERAREAAHAREDKEREKERDILIMSRY